VNTDTITRRYFDIRPEAHKKMRCAKCRGFLLEGEAAVTVTGPGWTHAEHDDPCPALAPMQNPDRRVVQ
jgi:hypothetical protein